MFDFWTIGAFFLGALIGGIVGVMLIVACIMSKDERL